MHKCRVIVSVVDAYGMDAQRTRYEPFRQLRPLEKKPEGYYVKDVNVSSLGSAATAITNRLSYLNGWLLHIGNQRSPAHIIV